MSIPSKYPHPTYQVTQWEEYGRHEEERHIVGDTTDRHPSANLVCSEISGTKQHTVMLDLDVPAELIPSSTAGHSHLYIDVPLPWRKYRRLLRSLRRAGLIEHGYYRASVRRKHTALRLPGVRK